MFVSFSFLSVNEERQLFCWKRIVRGRNHENEKEITKMKKNMDLLFYFLSLTIWRSTYLYKKTVTIETILHSILLQIYNSITDFDLK